jgi:DnaJ-class molecular chaperone
MPSNHGNEQIDFDANYYRILGIDEDATESDIKSAYRKLVKENHPDRNKSPRAVDVFKNVQDAYTILKNPDLKATYDASRTMLQSGLPHHHLEKHVDWGAEKIKKDSGRKTARNLAIFEQVTRPRTILLLGLPLLFGYLAFSSNKDDNAKKYKDAKPMLNQRTYKNIQSMNGKNKKDRNSINKTKVEKYISLYKNPVTKKWERPVVENMATGLYNTWEVKSVKVGVADE